VKFKPVTRFEFLSGTICLPEVRAARQNNVVKTRSGMLGSIISLCHIIATLFFGAILLVEFLIAILFAVALIADPVGRGGNWLSLAFAAIGCAAGIFLWRAGIFLWRLGTSKMGKHRNSLPKSQPS
jgi:hypothetical protein